MRNDGREVEGFVHIGRVWVPSRVVWHSGILWAESSSIHDCRTVVEPRIVRCGIVNSNQRLFSQLRFFGVLQVLWDI